MGSVLLSVGMAFRSSAPALIWWLVCGPPALHFLLLWTISSWLSSTTWHSFRSASPSIHYSTGLQRVGNKSRASLISFNQRRYLWNSSLVITTIGRANDSPPSLILFFGTLGLRPNIFAEFRFSLLRFFSGSFNLRGISTCLLCWWPLCLLSSRVSCPLFNPIAHFWILWLLILCLPCWLLIYSQLEHWLQSSSFSPILFPEPLFQAHISLNVYLVFIIVVQKPSDNQCGKNSLLLSQGNLGVESDDLYDLFQPWNAMI